jgi:hypothetical protein
MIGSQSIGLRELNQRDAARGQAFVCKYEGIDEAPSIPEHIIDPFKNLV